MKSPREILFKRLEDVEPKLNAIRENVLAEHLAARDGAERPVRRVFSPAFVVTKLWQELVWPCRRIWLGMAAVWVVVLIFSLATSERQTVVAYNARPTPDVLMELKEQRQMMAQLLEPGAPALAVRPRIPGPRSEQQQTFVIG